MANKKNTYPDWAEKYREKGKTIRKTKNGYALYHCTSEYVKGGAPKLKQEYLGIITEKDGFIPKKNGDEPFAYLEYGLSRFIRLNFKRDVSRHIYKCSDDLFTLGVVMFVFGSVDDEYIHRSFISKAYADRLCELNKKIPKEKISKVSNVISDAFEKSVPDADDRRLIRNMLILNVVEEGPASQRRADLPKELQGIFKKYGLKYDRK